MKAWLIPNLLLDPLPLNRGDALLAVFEAFNADFVDALENNQQDQALMQDREAL
jgi:hypothetical protein